MSMVKTKDGSMYPIADYAAKNCFIILLGSLAASAVLESMTEENLSEIKFLTDAGAVTGIYRNQLLCGYTDNGDTLTIRIIDADLCRYGLVLDTDNRIISAPPQRYAPEGVEIVDKLPEGNLTDWLRIDSEYVYDPLPEPEQPEPTPTQLDIIEAQVTYTAMMTDTLLEG